jgi:hypothetical protein
MPKAFIPQLEKGPFEFINKMFSFCRDRERRKEKKK